MSLYKWSQTGSTNATADPTVNFAEGQAPSSLNDSNRNAMAAVAKYRDDNAGAIVTTGTSAAYLVSSYQQFDTLAHLNGQVISFTPHVTNTGTQAFLNVDSLGSKTVRSATGIDVPAGTLIQGTPYEAVYNSSDGVFYLKSFYGSPYLIPIAATLDYWAGTAPNSSFAFPFGQAISRTTYAALFALIGGNYGSGDGSTTFNLPDLRGRVTASPDNMGGGSDPNRLTAGALAGVRNSIGGAGGESGHTLTVNELPSHTHANTLSDPGHAHGQNGNTAYFNSGGTLGITGSSAQLVNGNNLSTNNAFTGITINNVSQGGGAAHNVVQPTILCNRIMRII